MEIKLSTEKGGPSIFMWALVAALYLLLALGQALKAYDCNTYGKMQGRDTKYKILNWECYVKAQEGVYLPKKEWLERSIQHKQEIEIK